jgi:hypothetical protein
MMDKAGWMNQDEIWGGTWYELEGNVLPYPEALEALRQIGFTTDEAEEYLALVNSANWVGGNLL